MIRDPSDGSVREKSAIGIPITESKQPLASGLPTGSTKPEQIARLEKSREWLAKYRLCGRKGGNCQCQQAVECLFYETEGAKE